MAGGYFLIKSQMHGLVMDVEGGQALPGTRVLMYHQKDTNNDNQLFREDKKTGTIRSKMDNLCLDLQGKTSPRQRFGKERLYGEGGGGYCTAINGVKLSMECCRLQDKGLYRVQCFQGNMPPGREGTACNIAISPPPPTHPS